MSVIEVEGLTKNFKDVTALRGVDFTVNAGEIFGFLGPNGAGKSTTIKILSTLLKPSGGRAALGGFDVAREPDKVRRAIGLVFQDSSLDGRLTAMENLRFHAMLYDVSKDVFQKRSEEVLDMVQLLERRDDLVDTFSGGMKRRLEIARGLLHHPTVLFLDEPTVGLDPQTRNAIWEHIRRLRDEEGITVFMTTHYMDEAENCDRIAIIDHGEIQAIDTPEQLKKGLGGDKIVVTGDPSLEEALAATYGASVQAVSGAYHFQVEDGAAFLPRLMREFDGKIESVQVKNPSLDDVFLHLTGRTIRAEEGSALDEMRQMNKMWSGGRS